MCDFANALNNITTLTFKGVYSKSMTFTFKSLFMLKSELESGKNIKYKQK